MECILLDDLVFACFTGSIRDKQDMQLPFVLAYVIVYVCKTAIANELLNIEPWDPEFGMPVKVVWKPENERQGTVTDWWFEPADGWKPGPMTPEKERMKELCQPVIEWVKTMK